MKFLHVLRSPTLRRTAFVATLLVPVIVLLAHAYRRAPGAGVITINPAEEHQVIHGWEATAEAGLDEQVSHAYMDELLDKAMDFGLTRLRLEVRSSYEHTRDIEREFREGRISEKDWRCARYSTVNDNDDPRTLAAGGFQFARLDRFVELIVLPFKARLEKSGKRLWLNAQYVAFTSQICDGYSYAHEDPKEYAEFVLAVYQHLRDKYSLTPDSWEVMLEPDNTRIWTGDRMGQAMVQTIARLQPAGFTPSFIAPSTTSAGKAVPYFEEIWNRAQVRPFLRELSYHRYHDVSADVIADIGKTARKRKVASSMLEKMEAGYEELHQDLTLGGVSAWQQYVLGYPERDTGGHYFMIEPGGEAGKRVRLSASGHYLREYFRAIRPDARRIGASTDNDDFQAVAVRNVQGSLAVVVKAARPGQVTIRRLPPGAYRVSCWTDVSRSDAPADRCERTVTVGEAGTLATDIPGIGVLSIDGARIEGAPLDGAGAPAAR